MPSPHKAETAYWDAPLSRALIVGKGRLRTLRDAGRYLTDNYANITRSLALEHAIECLMKAAESGDRRDIGQATEQVARFLQGQRIQA